MKRSIKAKWIGGTFKLLEPINLPEGLEVEIIINEQEKDKCHIPFVSDKEQKEIEETLKNPDCHIVAFKETVEI